MDNLQHVSSLQIRLHTRKPSQNNAIHQVGMTLVELLVGILIGLIVVGAAATTIIISSSASAENSDMTQLQQQASYVFKTIEGQIKAARSYTLIPDTPGNNQSGFTFVLGTGVAANGNNNAYVQGLDNASSALTLSTGNQVTPTANTDVLMINYQARPRFNGEIPRQSNDVDCLGNAPLVPPSPITTPEDDIRIQRAGPASARRIINHFYLTAATGVPAASNLMCSGVVGNDNIAIPQPLAGRVEDLQISYLVNTTPTATSPSLKWVDGDDAIDPINLNGALPWENVVAVQACLQMVGNRRATASAPNGFGPQTQGCNNNQLPNDGWLRKVFRNTFYLENM